MHDIRRLKQLYYKDMELGDDFSSRVLGSIERRKARRVRMRLLAALCLLLFVAAIAFRLTLPLDAPAVASTCPQVVAVEERITLLPMDGRHVYAYDCNGTVGQRTHPTGGSL